MIYYHQAQAAAAHNLNYYMYLQSQSMGHAHPGAGPHHPITPHYNNSIPNNIWASPEHWNGEKNIMYNFTTLKTHLELLTMIQNKLDIFSLIDNFRLMMIFKCIAYIHIKTIGLCSWSTTRIFFCSPNLSKFMQSNIRRRCTYQLWNCQRKYTVIKNIWLYLPKYLPRTEVDIKCICILLMSYLLNLKVTS